MKKLLTAILLIVFAFSIGMFASCSGEYYDLTFERTAGVTYECEVKSGAKVLKGYEVKFSLDISENTIGVATVWVNGKQLTANNGVYAFVMEKDTVVSITGITEIKTYTVQFDKGDKRVNFKGQDNAELTEVSVESGTEVSFSVDVSVYYEQDGYEVMSNTEIIEPNQNGVYTVEITGDTVIQVHGLIEDEDFVYRQDGKGTKNNPYKISRPIDLYAMSVYINSEFWSASTFSTAYYELTCDLDMKGEQIYVIGDQSTSSAFFGGVFNGNGHTISNFCIKDTIINQSTFLEQFVPYVALFGYASGTDTSAPVIENLHLDNFTITANAGKFDSTVAVGSIVGVGVGAVINACSATNGTITVDADDNYFGYAGGLVGVLQSVFSDNVRYYATVQSSFTDVDISVESGYVYGAGGIVGYLMSHEEKTNAFVLNSYSTGDVIGGLNSGGIVGMADGDTAIINTYTTGDVIAQSLLPDSDSIGEEYKYANAGGIVGRLNYNSIVANSVTSGEIYAFADAGEEFTNANYTVGLINKNGEPYTEVRSGIEQECYYTIDLVPTESSFYKDTLKWGEEDWILVDGEIPTINYETTEKNFTITLDFGTKTVDGSDEKVISVNSKYLNMSYWYITYADQTYETIALPEFVTASDGTRSYGYFFDSQLTEQVPYSYVPTHDIKLYVGFANYNEVAGKYYLQFNDFNNETYVELSSDGVLTLVDGARTLKSTYVYDGEKIYMYGTGLARYSALTGENDVENYYYNFVATVNENGLMAIESNVFFPESSMLYAKKYADNFNYGKYYDGNNVTYVFHKDGKGLFDGEQITFDVVENQVIIYRALDNLDYIGTIGADGNLTQITLVNSTAVTAYDKFAGVWEKNATSHKKFTFDGNGNYSYEYYGYGTDKNVLSEKSGTYQNFGDYIVLDNGYVVTMQADKTLLVTGSDVNEVYYAENSFAGTWTFFNMQETVELVLNGINADGEGKGTLIYNGANEYEVTYKPVTQYGQTYLTIYEGDYLYASLSYSPTKNTLEGQVRSAYTGTFKPALFVLYDYFKGPWVSEIEGLELIEFNGFGAYDIKGTANYLAVKGKFSVNGKSAGYYELDLATMTATFTYNQVEYVMTYNEFTKTITITTDDGSNKLDTYDKWYGLTLYDNETTYDFDGRGDIATGGVFTITSSTGEKTYYTYKNEDGQACVYDNEVCVYRLYTSGENYFLSDLANENTQNVYVKNDFTGTWLVSTKSNTIVIGEMGATNTLTGTYLGTNVTYAYDGEKLTFNYQDATYQVIAMSGTLEIKKVGAIISYVAIPEEYKDNVMGTYSVVDGSSNEKIVFDGLGSAEYGIGTAQLYNANNEVIKVYNYYVRDGKIVVQYNMSETYLFVETTAGDGEFYKLEGTTKYYKLAKTDRLYLVKAYDDNGVEFLFDGIGNVTCDNGDVYSYTIAEINTTNGTITLVLVSDGTTYDAVLNCSDPTEYTITLTARN